MSKESIDVTLAPKGGFFLWILIPFGRNLKAHEGETFKTVTGLEFTYHFVSDNAICTNRTSYNLTRKNFEKALALFPIDKPGDISKIVRGGSYVYGLVSDERMG